MRKHDDDAGICDERQRDDHVAVEAMEQDNLVSDNRHKLQDDEDSCWQDREQVQHHADLVGVLQVEVAFSWCGAS